MQIIYADNFGPEDVRKINFDYAAAGMVLTIKAGSFVWQGYDDQGHTLPWLQEGAKGQVHQLKDDETFTVDTHAGPQVVTGHLLRDKTSGEYRVLTHVFLAPTDPPVTSVDGFDMVQRLFQLDVPAGATDLSSATLRVYRFVASA